MNYQTLGVADVGKMREQFHRIDELLSGFQAALDAEADQTAETMLQILRGNLITGIVGQAGISPPGHQRMCLEPARDFERIRRVLALAQRQRFQSLQKEERVERTERRTDVA